MKMILRTMFATLAMTTMFASSAMAAEAPTQTSYLLVDTSAGTSFQMNVRYTDSTSESIDCELDLEADLLSCGDLPDLAVVTVAEEGSVWVGDVDMDDWKGEVSDAKPTGGTGNGANAFVIEVKLVIAVLENLLFGSEEEEEKTKDECMDEFLSAVGGCGDDLDCIEDAQADLKDCVGY